MAQLRVAYVDLDFENKTLPEQIDFYTFNPYFRNLEIILRRFVISGSQIELHDGAVRIPDIGMIHDFDEVVLFSIPKPDQYKVLLEKNPQLKFRITRDLKKGQSIPFSASCVYSKIPNLQTGKVPFYHLPLTMDFSFIKKDSLAKKTAVVIYAENSSLKEVEKYLGLFRDLVKIKKNEYKLIVVGSFLKPPKDLDKIGYEIEVVPEITIGNLHRIYSSCIVFVDLASRSLGVIAQLAKRYECVYYSNLKIENYLHLDLLSSEEVRKLLMVSHFRDKQIQSQTKDLELN